MNSEVTSLCTNRVAHRPLKANDVHAITAMVPNSNVLRMLSSPSHPYTLAYAEGFIAGGRAQGNTPEDCAFAIDVDDALGDVIGIEPNSEDRPVLVYLLGEQFWNKGVMSEVTELMVERYFKTSQADALYFAAFLENSASIRIQEKISFA